MDLALCDLNINIYVFIFIAGPLMVITQRVTSLAYSLQDNLSRKESESGDHHDYKGGSTIDKMPSPLEFFAYTLAFQTLMCGPVVFYPDYINFIEGNILDGVRFN